ncbi:hypothetical protein [Marinomonas sp. THO17]|uniref:hypothetical protein n=1 Tax=Marinomonas sp. THO17 TaxID=3149048 RepID=UPI00336BE4D7
MAKNQISFFATQNDLLLVLNDVRLKVPYVFSFQEKSEEPSVYESPEEIEDLGFISVGDQNQSELYLLIAPGDEPKARSVEQRNGDIKRFYDQMSHPRSVSFRAGGLLNDSSCIIAGQVGTVSDDEWSIALYKGIVSSIKKRFTKIKSFYVGDEAAKKLDEGYRLTANIKSPVDYDLTR